MSIKAGNTLDEPTTSLSASHSFSEGQKFEFAWQDLNSAGQFINKRRWQQSQIPVVLETLPENLVVSDQLRNVLLWSSRRFEECITEQLTAPSASWGGFKVGTPPEDGGQGRSETAAAIESLPNDDSSDASTTDSCRKTRKPNPLLSRLKQIRQDVAAKMATRTQLSTAASSTTNSESTREALQNRECISCFDEFSKADLVHLVCSHDYCKACLREVVLNAMKTESAFPPKCCLTEVPLKTALSCLDNKQRDEYKDKSAEYSIPAGHRWYCPEPKCSKWIRPEKLQRSRQTQQMCPHCKILICSHCRAVAHDANQDCPQDFGLESTLEIAESEGWRRCYSCRTMVELTIGCRHITCRCGAQFCYVCNAKWRTCNCTEADKERRMQELRTRRQEQTQRQQEDDQAAQAEAEEIAEAIAQIEEMEREEAIRLAEEERQRALEEELLLAQLEEARLLEEIAKREAAEEAERQLQWMLLESSKEECQTLMRTLMQIINFQHASLMSDHEAQELSCVQNNEAQKAQVLEKDVEVESWLQENVDRRTESLHRRQRGEWENLLREAEAEEDEMFMQMYMYLKDKPNREQREKKMRDTLQRTQQEKQDTLQQKHEEERQRLNTTSHYEFEGLKKAASVRLEPVEQNLQKSLSVLGNRIGCDRRWFQLVSARRIEMLKEHKRLWLAQLEAEQHPVGLTQEQARVIRPMLPLDGEDEEVGLVDTRSSVEDSPVPVNLVQQPWQPTNEAPDLYSSPTHNATERPVARIDPYAATSVPQSQLSRADTVTRPIPGAYPASPTSKSRNTYPSATQPRMHRPSKSASQSINGAVSMSGVIAMPFTVPAKNEPQQAIAANTSATNYYAGIYYHNPSTSTEPSAIAATASTSTLSSTAPDTPSASTDNHSRRTSSRTSASTADADLLDSISANIIAGRGSSSIDSGKSRKSSGFFGRGFGKKKELSEEEIRRRMVGTVGDGFGI